MTENRNGTPDSGSKAILSEHQSMNVSGGVNIFGKNYYCAYCGEKFSSISEALKHELNCEKNPSNQK